MTAGTLYQCMNGIYFVAQVCSNGCQQNGAGINDACKPSAPTCGDGTCNGSEDKCFCAQDCGPYGATSLPPVQNWTGGTLKTDCTCADASCHSLYEWRVVGWSSGPDGPRATVEVRKLNGETIGAGRSWWVVVMAESDAPTCSNLSIFEERTSGVFNSTSTVQTVTFDVWPSISDPENVKTFGFLTDGATTPNQKTWFTSNTIEVARVCQ